MHLADQIVITEKASSTYLKTFFPNFEEVYGHKDNLQIVLHSESAPQIQISEGLSEITMQGRLRFLNPYNPHYDAVSLGVKVSAKIEFELLHDFTIAGKVVDMQINVIDMKAYFLTSVKIKELDVKVKALGQPFA